MSNNYRKWHSEEESSIKPGTLYDIEFPVAYDAIMARIDAIDPGSYARSRNFVTGAVTYLSPYISRGVISTRQVLLRLLQRGFTLRQMEKLVSELAWRDFFQRVWQAKGEDIFEDVRQPQAMVRHYQLPDAIAQATTGIHSIDAHINHLYATGYMHNHLRMYIASIACNIAGAHWRLPSQWMYYHLLDGDLASNSLSWQWVAGSFSSKKYFANQENINKYTGSKQVGTFLDVPYENLPPATVPDVLKAASDFAYTTTLPKKPMLTINPAWPVLLYHHYHLDPSWRKDESANRILVLEPSHFQRFPIGTQVMNFILALANGIPGLQVYTGEVSSLAASYPNATFISREHPIACHFPGIKDARDWLVPEVTGYFNSFFAYWKKVEKKLPAIYAM